MINPIFDFPVFPIPKTRYLNSFELLTKEIKRCLHSNYNDTSIAFSLNPEPGVEVGVKYFNEATRSSGKSYICVGDGLTALRLFLSTNSVQSFILSYGDLATHKNYLALRGKTEQAFTKEKPIDIYDLEIAGGLKTQNFTMETSYNPLKRKMGGWIVYRNQKIQLGCRLHTREEFLNKFRNPSTLAIEPLLALQKIDLVGVYTSDVFNNLSGSEMPNQYKISVSALDVLSTDGQSRIVGGYLHKVLYYGRAVTLAGEFERVINQNIHSEPTIPESVLRVGGAWQLSNRSAVKLRVTSNGDVDLLFGIGTSRTIPAVSVAIGVGFNVRSKLNPNDVRASLSIHLGG
ncbi:hypothetical protein K7432_001394 [Basidiobolus ranarum]|uniref:Bacterial surface antigen (D15) domain-containing protein n=1 Tax=Basidiobolus ranarum TaxID=34480 RepID=A0ABR2W9Q0_9FUNG